MQNEDEDDRSSCEAVIVAGCGVGRGVWVTDRPAFSKLWLWVVGGELVDRQWHQNAVVIMTYK